VGEGNGAVAERALGIDAGGSATRAVVVTAGEVVQRYESGPLNLLLNRDAFERLVSLIGESGATAAALGIAGLRGTLETQRLEYRLRTATGVDVVVADDTEIALLAAFEGRPGVVVIAGTGSNALGRNAAGEAARVGGHGFLLGDEGGAYWIANQALRAALRSCDGVGPKSQALEDAVTGAYALDFHSIVRLIHANPADRGSVTKVIDAVLAVDDEIVHGILDAAAEALIAMAQTIRAKIGPDLPVAMHGGIFRNERVRDRFVAATGAVGPAVPPEGRAAPPHRRRPPSQPRLVTGA
jgi:glucosamine kinase